MISRKRILSMTSTKKRDVMPQDLLQGGGGHGTYGPLTVAASAGTTYCLWCPTGRPMRTYGTNGGQVEFSDSARNRSVVFQRGLQERVRIATDTSEAWQWRRICWTMKGAFPGVTPVEYSTFFPDPTDSSGTNFEVHRTLVPLIPASVVAVQELIFRGDGGTDYTDAMTAPLDTSRIRFLYDRTVQINSGNDSGCVRNFKLWHRMNKNMKYFDTEAGVNLTERSFFATEGLIGMGDYYVLDFFEAIAGTGNLSFGPQPTMYWHEK